MVKYLFFLKFKNALIGLSTVLTKLNLFLFQYTSYYNKQNLHYNIFIIIVLYLKEINYLLINRKIV